MSTGILSFLHQPCRLIAAPAATGAKGPRRRVFGDSGWGGRKIKVVKNIYFEVKTMHFICRRSRVLLLLSAEHKRLKKAIFILLQTR